MMIYIKKILGLFWLPSKEFIDTSMDRMKQEFSEGAELEDVQREWKTRKYDYLGSIL